MNPINWRNDALQFAKATRHNLIFIEESKRQQPQADVHVVTQLILSLLGLVVFPKEKLPWLDDATKKTTIAAMASQGWPTWTITLDRPKKPTSTLADILQHLRNATTHGRLTFPSDFSREPILFEDKPNEKDAKINWRAEITQTDLRTFCLRFLDLIEDTQV